MPPIDPTPTPGDASYGLWLLCPAEAPRALPNLDGRTVEAIGGGAEWVVLDRYGTTSATPLFGVRY